LKPEKKTADKEN